jgi:CPA1 family monovalent cation:H+ antiporter
VSEQPTFIVSIEITILWMLVAVAAVALLTKRIRLPYTVALVIAGLIIAFVPGTPKVDLTPDLILSVFLPTLIFEAAYNLDFQHLRDNIRTISALAIPGVLLTAGVVAALMHYAAGFDWVVALLFGAIVAATDPVSVVATFKQLGAPSRLRTIIEGESLFNDGTSLVLFRVLVGILAAGALDPASSVAQFFLVIAGGLLVGLATGYIVARVMTQFDDYLVETVMTVILAYGTYFLAEQLHVSGVIAVVVAGLVVGNYAQTMSFSPTSRIAVGLSWEFFGFLTNSLIFLFVGLQVHLARLFDLWHVVVAIAAVVLSRAVAVVAVSWVLRILRIDRPLAWNWQVLLVWGGLRGSLSLAMALSLPYVVGPASEPFRERQDILVMTFGVIIFTLLVQGLTLRPLLERLGLVGTDREREEYERTRAALRVVRTAQNTLEREARGGIVTPLIAADLRAEYEQREQDLLARLESFQISDQDLRGQQLRSARRHLLTVERSTIRNLLTEGAISDESGRELVTEIDARLAGLEAATEPDGAAAAPPAPAPNAARMREDAPPPG